MSSQSASVLSNLLPGRLVTPLGWVWWWSTIPGARPTSGATFVRLTARWGPTAKLFSLEVPTKYTTDYERILHSKLAVVQMENSFSLKKYCICIYSIQFLLTMETMKLQIAKNLLKGAKKGSKGFILLKFKWNVCHVFIVWKWLRITNQYNILGFNEEIQEPQEVSMSGQTRYKLDLVFTLLYFVKMFL